MFEYPRHDLVMGNPDDMTDMDETIRAAYAFIERFGARAGKEASRRAQELREAGDASGCDRWLRIRSVIESINQAQTDSMKN